jgi:hypothetical protein
MLVDLMLPAAARVVLTLSTADLMLLAAEKITLWVLEASATTRFGSIRRVWTTL